jgi:type II secretory ATPase GspE/PulE/Tfp pilus assembly ATPase PilB-like protein
MGHPARLELTPTPFLVTIRGAANGASGWIASSPLGLIRDQVLDGKGELPMPGLFQNVATAMFLLLGQVDIPTIVSLPISLWRVFLLLVWVYACLHLVQRVEVSPLVPNQYKSLLYVVTLFAGPLVFLGLVVAETQKADGSGASAADFLQRIRGAVRSIWKSRKQFVTDESALHLFDASGKELRQLYGHGESQSGDRKFLDLTVQIIDHALQQRASDLLIDPKDQLSYAVRLRIDGTLRTVRELSGETCRAVINSIKAVSSMDISERRRPQDGAFTAKKGGTAVAFRVASAGALNGEKLSIRVLNQSAGQITLTDLGIPDRQRSLIVSAVSKPSGMVLICGPTGSGKTTTLYSMLNQIDRYTHNVITVEDPIEAPLAEASQIEINPRAGITFAKSLRSILRQDPDVICVGEIRDEETAEIALRAAQTGHLVLATLHCDSNATAIIRLLDLGVSPLLLSSGLSLLVSQRLVRKLCKECRKPAQLSPALLQEFQQKGIDTKNMFEATGCELCGGTGYYGRVAICDLLLITEELRTEMAQNGAISEKLKTEGDKKGRSNLKSEALRKVIAGITTLDEIKRVVG